MKIPAKKRIIYQKSKGLLQGFRLNIIYVGGTVELCKPFLQSLLENSTIPLRVVANGCSASEENFLKSKCSQFENASFFSLNSSSIIEHGLVLDQLLLIEKSSFFAFIDSDIFASPTICFDTILPDSEKAGIYSCLPIWHSKNDIEMPTYYKIMAGRFIRSSCGRNLGCTYMASYNAGKLRRLIEETGVSFRLYTHSKLPINIKSELSNAGFCAKIYDTAKVINILLQLRGQEIEYRPTPQLLHIGGLSCNNMFQNAHDFSFWKNLAKAALPVYIISRIRKTKYNLDRREFIEWLEQAKRKGSFERIIKKLQGGYYDINFEDQPPEFMSLLKTAKGFYKKYSIQ